ncbi:hypothetical protein [Pararhizobium gei]|uniref:hypothetical protein n=1 Tax=Pararhizobium gei TaxID=1395951 RepID=UPI0023DC3387|nr:hypothetical protein [Rhizobium gei]
MKFFAAALIAFLSAASSAVADGAPPPRTPTADGGKVTTVPETATKSYGRQREFVLPSGNIGCVYTPRGGVAHYQPADGGPELSCDRVEPRYIRATLAAHGPAMLLKDVGDQGCCASGPVLDYGETWTAGPFSCLSGRTGLSCNRADGHSFFLSRKRISAD